MLIAQQRQHDGSGIWCIRQVLSSSWDGRPFGHNRHMPKIGGCVPSGGAGSPSTTMRPRPRAYLHAKFHFSSWSIQPFGHNTPVHQRYRQTGHTNRTGHDRQRTDSIGRIVLQTVAQKGSLYTNRILHIKFNHGRVDIVTSVHLGQVFSTASSASIYHLVVHAWLHNVALTIPSLNWCHWFTMVLLVYKSLSVT